MGNFGPVSELRFRPGYRSYGKFQLDYRDEQVSSFIPVTGLECSYGKISSPVTEISVTGRIACILYLDFCTCIIPRINAQYSLRSTRVLIEVSTFESS